MNCILQKKNPANLILGNLNSKKKRLAKETLLLQRTKRKSWSRIGETFPDWGRWARLFEKGKAIKIRGLLLLLFIVVGSGTRHKRPIKRRKKTKRQGHKKTLVSLTLEEEEERSICQMPLLPSLHFVPFFSADSPPAILLCTVWQIAMRRQRKRTFFLLLLPRARDEDEKRRGPPSFFPLPFFLAGWTQSSLY